MPALHGSRPGSGRQGCSTAIFHHFTPPESARWLGRNARTNCDQIRIALAFGRAHAHTAELVIHGPDRREISLSRKFISIPMAGPSCDHGHALNLPRPGTPGSIPRALSHGHLGRMPLDVCAARPDEKELASGGERPRGSGRSLFHRSAATRAHGHLAFQLHMLANWRLAQISTRGGRGQVREAALKTPNPRRSSTDIPRVGVA